jgi:4'-phosphopantetheinyl transferase
MAEACRHAAIAIRRSHPSASAIRASTDAAAADSADVARVDVWRCDLDGQADADAIERDEHLLSADERARARRFHFAVHRRRFIACRALLRRILGSCVHDHPRTLRFSYGPFGKPALESGDRDLQFNLSHADGMAVFATTRHVAVGIDVERRRPIDDWREMGALVFGPEERRELHDASDRSLAFLNGWTRKEAMIKALGTGFAEPLGRLAVSLGPSAELRAIDSRHGGVSEWTVSDLSGALHTIALAVRARRVVLRFRAVR